MEWNRILPLNIFTILLLFNSMMPRTVDGFKTYHLFVIIDLFFIIYFLYNYKDYSFPLIIMSIRFDSTFIQSFLSKEIHYYYYQVIIYYFCHSKEKMYILCRSKLGFFFDTVRVQEGFFCLPSLPPPLIFFLQVGAVWEYPAESV